MEKLPQARLNLAYDMDMVLVNTYPLFLQWHNTRNHASFTMDEFTSPLVESILGISRNELLDAFDVF